MPVDLASSLEEEAKVINNDRKTSKHDNPVEIIPTGDELMALQKKLLEDVQQNFDNPDKINNAQNSIDPNNLDNEQIISNIIKNRLKRQKEYRTLPLLSRDGVSMRDIIQQELNEELSFLK